MRYKLTISYDGSRYHGFQRQSELCSVQEDIEKALSVIFKSNVIIHGAGRTDAGVHAVGQVAHFDHEQLIPCNNLKKVMNKALNPYIYIKKVEYVDDKFHAQKSAIKKEYRYRVSINEFNPIDSDYVLYFHDRIDISKIREAMTYIIGEHDFKSFAKVSKKYTVRTIESFDLIVKDGILEFRIVGNGFLYNMVRIIVALMLKVGEGKFEPYHIKEILDGKSRSLAPFVAPPQGLYLYKVYYEEEVNE